MSGRYKKYNDYNELENFIVGMTSKGTSFFFDKEEFPKIKFYTWFDDMGYISTHIENNKKVKLHKFILDTNNGVEFINGNKKDCRKENLRISRMVIV